MCKQTSGRVWQALFAFHAALFTSCTGGTETDNPFVDFGSSECKTHGGAALTLRSDGVASSALTLDTSEYDGLHCYAWTLRDGGKLRIDITNMQGGCGVEWAGRVDRDGDGLALIAENTQCAVAACGWCIYDVSFELDHIDADKPLAVSLGQDDCEKIEPISKVVLPLDEQAEGVVCQPAFKYAVLGLGDGCSSELHKPCMTAESIDESQPYHCMSLCEDNGLVCAELADDDQRCLQPCKSNDDCPLGDLMSCQAGLCKLAHPF